MVSIQLVALFVLSGALGQLSTNSQHAEVRLSHGWYGRVEVRKVDPRGTHQFGTVCDDDWDDQDCLVVCRQIGCSGGNRVPNAVQQYGAGTGNIWLDDVACRGDENYLDECKSDFWGSSNCKHSEDAGCICSGCSSYSSITAPIPTNPPVISLPVPVLHGSCNVNLHQLKEFDPIRYPGIGRVEIRSSVASPWSSVCDDYWDDSAARVFCSCLGYSNSAESHAFWSPNLASLAVIPMIYDSVRCSATDVLNRRNLHDCNVTPVTGRCGSDESAAVACKAVPRSPALSPPNVNLACDGKSLQVCFTSTTYMLSKQYLTSTHMCAQATARDISSGVCMDINMQYCPTSAENTTVSSKNYCYDISYTQYDNDPRTLLVDQVWTRRACCEVAKNGTVTGSFQPVVVDHAPVSANAPTEFSLECYPDETFSTGPYSMPVSLTRGQDVFCRVTAKTWDPKMYLVVPHCKFMATAYGAPEYIFHNNKCPTSTALDLNYFSFDGHNWGFKFPLPKFQGYHEVYLQCDAYICDTNLDHKPYCDRSCEHVPVIGRRRRSVDVGQGEQNSNRGRRVTIKRGPFTVKDNGFGPFITSSGTVTVVKSPMTDTHRTHNEHIISNQKASESPAVIQQSLSNQKTAKSPANIQHRISNQKAAVSPAVIQPNRISNNIHSIRVTNRPAHSKTALLANHLSSTGTKYTPHYLTYLMSITIIIVLFL